MPKTRQSIATKWYKKCQKLAAPHSRKYAKKSQAVVTKKCQKVAGPRSQKNSKKSQVLGHRKIPRKSQVHGHRKNAKNTQVRNNGKYKNTYVSSYANMPKICRSIVTELYHKCQKLASRKLQKMHRSAVMQKMTKTGPLIVPEWY